MGSQSRGCDSATQCRIEEAMKLSSENPAGPEIEPIDVHVIKVLGKGRAATARLVDVTLGDGSTIRAVEKLFAPGLLTRTIYRLAFWAPFAYRDNRNAILTAYYRRRIAAEIFRRSNLPVSVAQSRYVRFDEQANAWVLGADWIQGRGIRPAPPARPHLKNKKSGTPNKTDKPEIQQRIEIMRQAGDFLHHAGLGGSVWQIDPAAMVSTANMLRVDDQHVIVDLESGMPAILLPRYILQSIKAKSVPPFDDLNPAMLRQWIATNNLSDQIQSDARHLIDHDRDWKAAEPTPLRHVGGVSAVGRIRRAASQATKRLRRRGVIKRDDMSPSGLFAVWILSCIPIIGEHLASLIGNREQRDKWTERLVDRQIRRQWLDDRWQRSTEKLIDQSRIATDQRLGRLSTAVASVMAKWTLAPVQRFVLDPRKRAHHLRGFVKLLTSARYQRLCGTRWMQNAIAGWLSAGRMTPFEAASLRREADDVAVAAYSRGLAFHVMLKFLTPVVAPLKFGSLAVFFYGGNVMYLLPMFALPAARTVVTLGIGWSLRRRGETPPPLRHALIVGCLPTVGTSAFAIQMAAFKPHLSEFLIRDAASKIGRRLPIYGGADSRTEMAAIAVCDPLLYVIDRMLGKSNMTGTVPLSVPLCTIPLSHHSLSNEDPLSDAVARGRIQPGNAAMQKTDQSSTRRAA